MRINNIEYSEVGKCKVVSNASTLRFVGNLPDNDVGGVFAIVRDPISPVGNTVVVTQTEGRGSGRLFRTLKYNEKAQKAQYDILKREIDKELSILLAINLEANDKNRNAVANDLRAELNKTINSAKIVDRDAEDAEDQTNDPIEEEISTIDVEKIADEREKVT